MAMSEPRNGSESEPQAREARAKRVVTEGLQQKGPPTSPAWRHYNERLRPVLQASGFASLGNHLSRVLSEIGRPIEVLSLGGGSGDHELALARSFSLSYNIRWHGGESGRFDQTAEIARKEGLRIEFAGSEIEALVLDRRRYDLVVMRGIFHRVLGPEAFFESISGALAPSGLLQIEDVVGENHRILWEENEWFVNALLERLPEKLTRGARVAAPGGDDGLGGPCHEAILGLLRRRFSAVFEHRHGAFMRFVCAHPELGHTLGAADTAARNSLDFLIDSDDSAVRHELLRPLELWGVYRQNDISGVL